MTLPPSRHYRPVGATGLRLPRLGFGAAPLGNLYRPMTDAEASRTLLAALAERIDYFDTAPHYGFGLSERRLGQTLSGQSVTVSSKIGRSLEPLTAEHLAAEPRNKLRFGFAETPALTPVFDYGYEAVLCQLSETAQRLGGLPNMVFAHDLGALTHGDQAEYYWRQFLEGGYRALLEYREAGRIQAIGLGVNEVAVCDRALDELSIDVLLLAGRYTLLDQSGLRVLNRCGDQGVAVVIGGAFNSGILATGMRGDGPHYYNYEAAPMDIKARVSALQIECDRYGVSLPAAALQFASAHPAVVSVVAGCAGADQVTQASLWMNADIPRAFWEALRAKALLPGNAPVPGGLPGANDRV